MWLILLYYCLYWLTCASSWYPVNSMLGEQIDLITGINESFIPNWTKSVENEETKNVFDTFVTNNASTQFPFNSINRDRELLDEVERIEPKHWPDILYTRTIVSSTTETPLLRNPLYPLIFIQKNSSMQRYPPIAASLPTVSIDEVFCDFGSFPAQTLCEWQNGDSILDWVAGTGMGTNWMGGPSSDYTTGTMEGGYAFLETSKLLQRDDKTKNLGGLLHSPQLGSTGVVGTCIMFKYSMDGLSIAGLRVLLHVGVDEYSIKKEQTEEIIPENTTIPFCKPMEIFDERVIWNAQYYTLGVWQQIQMLYTYPDVHSLIIEGIPVDSTDPARLYRGYIAVDDIDLQPGTSCIGFCNFAGGFCDWANDADDDFDWTISRGSGNPTTGPAMDSSTDRLTAGGYAYIDSSFPRRPGDKARLVSTSFPAPSADAPMCMHFWFHMFGSGIGTLKLLMRHFRSLDAPFREIWSLNGNAGNTWFIAQITISSLDDFQLLFEASVGNTGMGDIAIDDISFAQGSCPALPQVAVPIPRDCTFEIDECDWINSRDPDRVEWERLSVQALNLRNQRKPYSNGYIVNRRNEYFLGLGRPREGYRSSGGGTAQLVSREMKGSEEPLCVTFWYFMFESFIDSAGPSLGVLRVSIQTIEKSSIESRPIWQLYNNQGPTWNYAQININERENFNVIFEGTWGPNRASGSIGIDDISFYIGNCSAKPSSASVRPEDCSFEKGLCGWENITSSENERTVTWQRAFLTHRPAQLLDKTFGATGNFVFFDIFTTNKQSTDVRLRSPIIQTLPDEESVCFTFWFAAFGVEESTTLQIIKMNTDKEISNNEENDEKQQLWSLTAKGFNNPRPVWTAAQVTIDARVPYRLILKGSANNGGFAIDDIKFQPQSCIIRPAAAQPNNGS
ncbi:MAM and LDL-receptor class A domain-containing protein 1 [Apis mellifera]|uniref:MAM and LDL-receptor class A domain-containing protein 1 n=1 Tax=Apis mellifera TaxID=7460 RepID=A0A7M7GLV2_APIME|nr:MAM and LDL-receptor class A domain-containing protein 1 [Apis mellifera]|eukprot:XP_006560272.2 MAM and LDL-receptor class A domain-containing protein 1 [Apis mellifera]